VVQVVLSRTRISTFSLPQFPPVLGDSRPVGERRFAARYPVELTVRFRSLSARSRFSGVGRVVNASRGGVLVVSEDEVDLNALVEMLLDWPCLLDGRIPLQLFAAGRVIRRGTSDFVATIERYEFRTKSNSSLTADLLAARGC
jgi:hypothetical protein